MKNLSQNSKRFLIWLTIIIVGLIGIDFSIGAINDLFFRNGSVRIDGVEHLILDADEEIIIMGNSAAACHFNAANMEKALGMTCYNAGTYGSTLKFNLLALKGLVNHHHPKLIILALNPANFTDNTLGQTSIKFPCYYGRAGEEFDRAIEEIYPYRSKLLRFNMAGADQNMFRRLAYKSGLVTFPYKKGYQPYPVRSIQVTPKPLWNKPLTPNAATMRDLEEFIRITRMHNIKVLLILAPNCVTGSENDLIIRKLKPYADNKTIAIWDDTRIFPIPESIPLFYDLMHLNDRGASVYTDSVCKRIFKYPFFSMQ